MSNGNLVVQGSDLDLPGQRLNMRRTHTYNSQKDQREFPLGRGRRLGVATSGKAERQTSKLRLSLRRRRSQRF